MIYDVDGWAHHRRSSMLGKYAPADFGVTSASFVRARDLEAALGNDEPDIILLLRTRFTERVRAELLRRGWRSLLIVGWTAAWPLRRHRLQACRRVADAVLFNNAGARSGAGSLPQTFVIPNGVDLDTFRITVPPRSREPRVLWVGSEQARGWKGYDRILLPLRERLESRGIACDYLLVDSWSARGRSAAEMAKWYNRGTVLLCASLYEGTPNPGLEAAACGCTVVSTRVGNMTELIEHGVNGFLVKRSVPAFAAAVESACRSYPALAEEMSRRIRSWSWEDRCAEHFRLFRKLLRSRRRSPPASEELFA